jgi:ABC-type transporter Mla subunit MlaD
MRSAQCGVRSHSQAQGLSRSIFRPRLSALGQLSYRALSQPQVRSHSALLTPHSAFNMALQDLTPQLRTRLSRMERAVGWFVFLAVLLLAFGFGYYLYDTAERKGWFLTKVRYFTFVNKATGLKVGDPVMLMGFDAGAISAIKPMPADQFMYNVFVEFELKAPNYGYIWTEGSQAKITTADLLGKRVLEVTKGTGGYPTYISHPMLWVSTADAKNLPEFSRWVFGEEFPNPNGTNLLAKPFQSLDTLDALAQAGYTNLLVLDTRTEQKKVTGVWNEKKGLYDPPTAKPHGYYLHEDESPAVTEQLQRMVTEVEQALPNIFNLTNDVALVLSNSASLTSNLNVLALSARPAVSNLASATKNLDQPGSLGEWLIPTNLNRSLEATLSNANAALVAANTNLASVMDNLNLSLDNVADITSNLNKQVEANTNMLSTISGTVTHADEFVQGLKRFWLFKHLFKSNTTNAAPARVPLHPARSPKGAEQAK